MILNKNNGGKQLTLEQVIEKSSLRKAINLLNCDSRPTSGKFPQNSNLLSINELSSVTTNPQVKPHTANLKSNKRNVYTVQTITQHYHSNKEKNIAPKSADRKEVSSVSARVSNKNQHSHSSNQYKRHQVLNSPNEGSDVPKNLKKLIFMSQQQQSKEQQPHGHLQQQQHHHTIDLITSNKHPPSATTKLKQKDPKTKPSSNKQPSNRTTSFLSIESASGTIQRQQPTYSHNHNHNQHQHRSSLQKIKPFATSNHGTTEKLLKEIQQKNLLREEDNINKHLNQINDKSHTSKNPHHLAMIPSYEIKQNSNKLFELCLPNNTSSLQSSTHHNSKVASQYVNKFLHLESASSCVEKQGNIGLGVNFMSEEKEAKKVSDDNNLMITRHSSNHLCRDTRTADIKKNGSGNLTVGMGTVDLLLQTTDNDESVQKSKSKSVSHIRTKKREGGGSTERKSTYSSLKRDIADGQTLDDAAKRQSQQQMSTLENDKMKVIEEENHQEKNEDNKQSQNPSKQFQDQNLLQLYEKNLQSITLKQYIHQGLSQQPQNHHTPLKGFKGNKKKSASAAKTKFFVPDFLKPSLELKSKPKKPITTFQQNNEVDRNSIHREQQSIQRYNDIKEAIAKASENCHTYHTLSSDKIYNKGGSNNKETNRTRDHDGATCEGYFEIKQFLQTEQLKPQLKKSSSKALQQDTTVTKSGKKVLVSDSSIIRKNPDQSMGEDMCSSEAEGDQFIEETQQQSAMSSKRHKPPVPPRPSQKRSKKKLNTFEDQDLCGWNEEPTGNHKTKSKNRNSKERQNHEVRFFYDKENSDYNRAEGANEGLGLLENSLDFV